MAAVGRAAGGMQRWGMQRRTSLITRWCLTAVGCLALVVAVILGCLTVLDVLTKQQGAGYTLATVCVAFIALWQERNLRVAELE